VERQQVTEVDDEHDETKLFHEGVDLFNAGEWFEAHEVWEDAWHLAEGQRKRFYQGLIQCAVTLEHVRRGNPRGVRSVMKTALPKFEGLPAVYLGVDVPKLIADMKAAVQPILDLPAETFDPALPRGQQLPFDPAKAPKITLS
jgi:uncharacterized protein